MKINNFYLKEIITIFMLIIFNLFINQDLLERYIPSFKYLDEFSVIIIFAIFIFSLLKGKIKKIDLTLLILSFLLIFIGVTYNFYLNIQPNKEAIFIDILNTFKFLFLYIGFKDFSEKYVNKKKIVYYSTIIAKIIILILFVSMLATYLGIGSMYAGIRYGFKEFSFLYSVPGVVINQCTYFLIILTASLKENNSKNTKMFLYGLLIIMISTLKTRAFVLVSVYMLCYYIFIIKEKNSIKLSIIPISFFIGIIGYSQFNNYFIEGNGPRSLFLRTSIKICKEIFPWGTGFATFGSFAAGQYYSPLYYLAEFNERYGMSPYDKQFLYDNYWPSIIAQFGIIGLMIMIIILILFFKNIYKCMSEGKYSKAISVFFIIDVIFSSIQSSYISHPSMVVLVLCILICFNKKQNILNNELLKY